MYTCTGGGARDGVNMAKGREKDRGAVGGRGENAHERERGGEWPWVWVLVREREGRWEWVGGDAVALTTRAN